MSSMDEADAEVLREFVIENRENLDKLDSEFVELERDPTQKDRLAAIFRTVHTIKGTSGFLGFPRLEAVTHAGENLLSRLRDATLFLSPAMTTTLLKLIDALRRSIDCIDKTNHEAEEDYSALITELHQHTGSQNTAKPQPSAIKEEPTAAATAPAVTITTEPTPIQKQPEPVVAATGVVDSNHIPPPATPAAVAPAEQRSASADTTVRVDVGLLDKLMNLVGELVLTRNQILQYGSHAADPVFATVTQRLNLLTTELQEGVMKTRMRPIGNVWSKLPRLVREVALTCGKQVTLTTEGQDTELDRTVLEAINDPLIHLVRNAIDHGIETPNVRGAQGKSVIGKLNLRAFHEGGQVHIEVTDDGAGINIDVVRKKGIERGLVTAERAAEMTDQEIAALIFSPGFSTSQQITNVSGRGVGMDVVKTNIEQIGGVVDLHNRPGNGTTVRIKIPLTLAIIPALLVSCHGDRFAIPQVNLLELVRLEGEQISTAIEAIEGCLMYRLRGNLLPLVALDRVLELPEQVTSYSDSAAISIVVLQADSQPFGLVVSGINDTEEIVVKSLDKTLKRLAAYGGATILGDGSVALILDVHGIAQRANIVGTENERAATNNSAENVLEVEEDRHPMLLAMVGDNRIVVPLECVARLEEIPRTSIEKAGNQHVVQYRGKILPLVDLHDVLGGAHASSSEQVQVVVYNENDHSIGIVVDRILDIIEESMTVKHNATRPGVLGCAVLQGHVTELLDVHEVISSVDPSFFEVEQGAVA